MRGRTSDERFWNLVQKSSHENCWSWIGAKERRGHGRFKISTKICEYAHRYSYMLHIGSIPDGKCVLHKCDNGSCVNPSHLFLGTRGENNTDRATKGRNAPTYGECNPSAKLTAKQVKNIIERRANGDSVSSIANDFNVSLTAIYGIISGKTWKNLNLTTERKIP